MTGKEVIAELVVELRASVEAAEQFEGEMRNLAAYAKALAQALDCIRSAGGNRSVTLLQPPQESKIRSCLGFVFTITRRRPGALQGLDQSLLAWLLPCLLPCEAAQTVCLSPGSALHPLRW